MRALIIYFSVTGTTRRVARSIAAGLEDAGAEVSLLELPAAQWPDARDFDLIGIGFPVHWYRMPTPVCDAIDSLGQLGGRLAFVFALHGTYRGAGLNRARAALHRAGAVEVGVFTCHGEGSFLGYLRLGHQFSTGHPDEVDLAAASDFGRMLPDACAAAAAGAPPLVPPHDPRTHWVYAIERAVVAPWLVRSFYRRCFHTDPGLCTRCGKCARACPTHSIVWHKGEIPVWGAGCIMCLTCALVCPEAAVHSPIDWPVFRPFLRYNIRRAARDAALVHSLVELRRGVIVHRDREGEEGRVLQS